MWCCSYHKQLGNDTGQQRAVLMIDSGKRKSIGRLVGWSGGDGEGGLWTSNYKNSMKLIQTNQQAEDCVSRGHLFHSELLLATTLLHVTVSSCNFMLNSFYTIPNHSKLTRTVCPPPPFSLTSRINHRARRCNINRHVAVCLSQLIDTKEQQLNKHEQQTVTISHCLLLSVKRPS